MVWPELKVGSWTEFLEVMEYLASLAKTAATSAYMYRGLSDAGYKLEPSIVRDLSGVTSAQALQIEDGALEEFKAQAALHLPAQLVSRPMSAFGWWSLMQHYSAPTRLLDWTTSPFVAAYFAVREHFDRPGAVRLFNSHRAEEKMVGTGTYKPLPQDGRKMDALWKEADGPHHLYFLRRDIMTDRMVAQQGQFTICRQILSDHGAVIDELLGEDAGSFPPYYLSVVIPPDLKIPWLARLRAMNISANALFPGIDGIGRSVSEVVRLSRVTPPSIATPVAFIRAGLAGHLSRLMPLVAARLGNVDRRIDLVLNDEADHKKKPGPADEVRPS